jgi:hypothetical protein
MFVHKIEETKKPEFRENKQPPLDDEEWMNMGHPERRDIKTKKTPNPNTADDLHPKP